MAKYNMKHSITKRQLVLYAADEVSDADRASIDIHLRRCASCRSEIEKLRAMRSLLINNAPPVDDSVLTALRRDLIRRIRGRDSRPSVFETVRSFLGFSDGGTLRPVLTIVTVACAAFIGGMTLFTPESESVPLFSPIAYDPGTSAVDDQEGLNAARVISVSIISRDDESGDIEFEFEATFRSRVRGNMSDPAIQNILARALVSSQNPGVRLRAVNAFSGSFSESTLPEGTRKVVKHSLISALKYDENHGVRLEALKALEAFMPDSAATEAIVYVLTKDSNSAIKIAAINTLDLSKYTDATQRERLSDVLRKRSLLDENNYIRIKAKAALQEVSQ